MRTTVLSRVFPSRDCKGAVGSALLLCALLSVPLLAATKAATPDARIADLASSLSQGDSYGALEAFDRSMKNFGTISSGITALVEQAEVTCAIDIVEDKEADDESASVHHLDLDWYMLLKSRTDPDLVERRRQRVAVTLQRLPPKSGPHNADVWRITSLAPAEIFAPIVITPIVIK